MGWREARVCWAAAPARRGIGREAGAQGGRAGAMRERDRARTVVGDVALDPHLGFGDLSADRRLRVLGEVRVPEGVVADLVAVARQVLELAPLVLGLVEEPIGLGGAWQHV